jgi:prepilin-type N-terminal cleavage/methylation domain-containing protein
MKKIKGFTLIEVVIVSLITGIVGLGVVYAIANSNTIMNRSYEQAMVNGNLDMVHRTIEKDVKEGVALSAPSDWSNELIITYPDLTQVRWTVEYNSEENGLMPTRYGRDGSKRSFHLFGSEGTSKTEWKYIYPYFRVNRDLVTGMESREKYDRVWVKLGVYIQNGDSYYNNWTAEKTMHCRLEHIGYGL